MDILELIQEIDVRTSEALAYAMYFDYVRKRRKGLMWDHYTIRAFILSISYMGEGYYSVLRKVKDEILFRDISELEKFKWLRGWIFQKDKDGKWWVIVDGETEAFEKFKKVYKELMAK